MALIYSPFTAKRPLASMLSPFASMLPKDQFGWGRRRRLDHALVGYPIFRPPHVGAETEHTPARTLSNFAYFMSQRIDRLADGRYLLAKFDVDVRDGAAVDVWLTSYGRCLVPSVAHVDALVAHHPVWRSEYSSLNVVLDLAIALGEVAIANDGRWQWEASGSAWGTGAVLSNGLRQVDLVRELAVSCRDPGRHGFASLRSSVIAG
jgi:hypothetical protein